MIAHSDRHSLLKRFTTQCATCALVSLIGWAESSLAQAPVLPSSASAQPQQSNTGPSSTPSLTEMATEHANLIEQYRQRINDFQSEYGPYDERLIEPLENLTRALLEVDNHKDALVALEQQQQIYRVNDGLYTARQIPLIESRLQAYAATGEWSKVSDTLGYLSWVYQRDTSLPVDQQLSGLKELGSWHLTAVGHDSREREAYHLLQLGKMEQQAADLAELYYGADSEALTPFLYDQALANTYIALAIMLTSATSQDLMYLTEGIRNTSTLRSGPGFYSPSRLSIVELEAMYGSKASTVIERSFKSRMGISLAQLQRIREIYQQNDNPEGEGMALMYLGDSILLRQQYEKQPGNFAGVRRGTTNPGPAMGHYEQALEAFRQAGLPEELTAAYTRCPVLLPITHFATTVQEALSPCERSTESEVTKLGSYDLASTLIPGLEGDFEAIDTPMSATIQFSVRSNGQISSFNIVDIAPDNTANRVRVRKLSELMQFRPAILAGKAQRTEQVQLVVRMPAASSEQ